MPVMQPSSQSLDQPILTAMALAYAGYAQRSAAWLEGYARAGGAVHCRSGCFHCCNLPIQVSLAEALLTAAALSTAQMQSMRRRAARVIQNAKSASDWNEYFQTHRAKVGYCPLLDVESGACTAYEVRPARCRDTFSALSSKFCEAGGMERLTRAERVAYNREVKENPATDGVSHYIAPLEELGEPIWEAASDAMRSAWGLEIWGDFWVLTTLTQDAAFMAAVRSGAAAQATRRAKALGLWHLEIVRIEE